MCVMHVLDFKTSSFPQMFSLIDQKKRLWMVKAFESDWQSFDTRKLDLNISIILKVIFYYLICGYKSRWILLTSRSKMDMLLYFFK